MLDFSRLQAPRGDGEVLVEPSHAQLCELAEDNHALLGTYDFPILDTDARSLRTLLRRSVCAGCTAPTVLTGHQPEFIHAGVWAKHVVASKLAESFDGKAINFVVDNDSPKRTVLEIPTVVDSAVRVEAVRYATLVAGATHESIARLDLADIQRLERVVRGAMGDRYSGSSMPVYFASMTENGDAVDWVDQMVDARRAIERAFGVEMIEQRVSRAWFGPMLADLIVNAERFMQCYNAALSEYRVANRVRSDSRPVPDLVCAGSRCELPVWAYRLGGPRRRVFVERSGDRVILYADDDRIGEASLGDLSTWDRAHEALDHMACYAFRPRALSLTLWARVFIGDLFLHGIGGAKYDRITDGLIRRYYGVEPPAMACVSATMRMDLPHDDVDAGALRAARARARDVRFNPQRHVRLTAESSVLMEERARWVERSLNLRNGSARDRRSRREVFGRIRTINERLLLLEPASAVEADARVEDLAARLARNSVAERRDFFFGMLNRNRLGALRDRLAATVAHRV